MARARRPVPRDEAADRISAYVYGNILVLAALVLLHDDEIRDGAGLAIVLGTAASTFIAHAFSEWLGSLVRGRAHTSPRVVLRDSLPVVSAAAAPALLMLVGSLEWVGATTCLRLAEVWVVARMAATGFVVSRVAGRPATLSTLVASALLALVAVAIVAVKVALTH